MQIELDGVAIVTGGGNGIGAAIAECLAGAGATVAVVDRDGVAAADVASRVGGVGFAADVADQSLAEATARKIRDSLGPCRYLVANAGVVSPPGQPFTDNSEEDWDRCFAVNVKGAAFWAGAVVDDLKETAGSIVVISSIVGVVASPFLPPYSVSKSAANGLTRVLARQLAPEGVTVNAIAPGYVWSPLWVDLGVEVAKASDGAYGTTAEEVFANRVSNLVPMRRAQTPEDIAHATSFLCSDLARNITGQIIGVDGGITI